ncbi:MAG: hypothetical protein ABW133_02110 [Polyangiaceae bacterium]
MVLTEQTKRIQLEDDTEIDGQKLDDLLVRVTKTIQDAASDVQPRVADHAALIQNKAREVVELGQQALRQTLTEDLAEIEQNILQERRSSLAALEKVLLGYDLPEAKNKIHVRLAEVGRYTATMESVTPYGMTTTLDLTIPSESAFAHDARVERILEGLEIRAPETAGWIRKESRMVPQKLNRFHITELTIGEESVIKLRSSPEAQAAGYDITLRSEEPQVRIVKTGKDGEAGAFDPDPADLSSLFRLREKLEEEAQVIATKRRALTSARLDDEPVEQSARMRAFVEQLMRVVAPMVREIAAHSLSPGELVLRRMIGGDRREEIFVTTAELQATLDGLSDADRQLFSPLELDSGALPTAWATRVSQAPAARSDRAPESGVKRSNRPPPMRSVGG